MRTVAQEPGTLSIPEAAHRVGMTAPTLRRAIAEGNAPFHAVRIGRFLRIPTSEVEAVVGGLDLDAARAYLARTLPGEPVEIDDDGALDRAVAVVRGGAA